MAWRSRFFTSSKSNGCSGVANNRRPNARPSGIRLAYYLLLSLEFLIAADIIDTIVQPGLEELAILGGIIAIRTVISLSMNWELKSKSD